MLIDTNRNALSSPSVVGCAIAFDDERLWAVTFVVLEIAFDNDNNFLTSSRCNSYFDLLLDLYLFHHDTQHDNSHYKPFCCPVAK